MSLIEVVNRKYAIPREGDIYVGRGSPLGNPHKIGPGMARGSTLHLYRAWLDRHLMLQTPPVIQALTRIAERVQAGEPTRLVCFCKPHPCHGDYIKQVVEEALALDENTT